MKITGRLFIALSGFLLSSAYAGTPGSLDAARLGELMKKAQPCCVIDARDEGLRGQQSIPFAIVYAASGIKVKMEGYALVVANNDEQALVIARKLAGTTGADVYAVIGGYNAWMLAQGGDISVMPDSFSIPTNTCEQGKFLRVYDKSGPKEIK